ncbi:THO2 protein [Cavenderia fasciculata]|uniref:THO2 protein n=1 Tax=Cavenderia fasciculata TaxID=261658 RepID=F4PNT4_CACFS|nr:THO2 protein [Cavenderia fasciculata]EGG23137.1 THO2 protein [Cavenderia fasciculata]|eukprot:XP_004360988.1 THO2 protein [Cavenderia fasciculata]
MTGAGPPLSTSSSSSSSTVDINSNHSDIWESSTKPQLTSKLIELTKKVDQNNKTERYATIRKILYDECTNVTKKQLSITQILSLFANDSIKIMELNNILADIFWCIGIEMETSTMYDKPVLIQLINECVKKSIVEAKLLKERLEPEMLEECGIINQADKFVKKTIRINTINTYTQVKYNLFKEETEGFSKIISELNKGDRLNEMTLDSTIDNIKSLIGYFNLDPNRVLDIVLDAYELNIQNSTCFNSIIKLFKPSAIPQLLGFKYQYFQNQQDTPSSLYDLTAILLKSKIITLEQIYPHLGPNDEDLKLQYQSKKEETIANAKKIGMISLVDKDIEKEKEGEKKETIKDGDKKELKDQSQQQSPATTTIAQPSLDHNNQKFGVLISLLNIDEHEYSNQLLYHLSNVDPASNSIVCKALCKRLTKIINPIYQKISFSILKKSLIPGTIDIEEFIKQSDLIYNLLYYLNVYLSTDTILLNKIVRILKDLIQSVKI